LASNKNQVTRSIYTTTWY